MQTRLTFAALLLGLAVVSPPGAAQQPTSEDKAASSAYHVDVAVPEAPAFLLTDGSTGTLTRPSTVRDFSTAFGSFTDEEGNFVVPKSFAVEVAPRLLFFGRGLTVYDYAAVDADVDMPTTVTSVAANATASCPLGQEVGIGTQPASPAAPGGAGGGTRLVYCYPKPNPNYGERVWSTLRMSVATQRSAGSDQTARIAIGFRSSPVNGADPRLNDNYRRRIRLLLAERTSLNARINMINEGYTDGLEVPDVNAPPPPAPAPAAPPAQAPKPPVPAVTGVVKCDAPVPPGGAFECRVTEPPTPAKEENETLRGLIRQRDEIQTRIDAVRKEFEESRWNATALEFAGAMSLAALDSTGRSAKPDEYAAWGTYTQRLTRWGQGLLGVRLRSARDTVTAERGLQGLAGGRLYMGRNTVKGFVEGQLPFGHDLGFEPVAAAGAELKLFSEIWATFSAGYEWGDDSHTSRMVTRFSIRTGRPLFDRPESTIGQRMP
jgi:hypothetical protein